MNEIAKNLLKENALETLDGLCRIREQLELLGQSLEREILSIDTALQALEQAGAAAVVGAEADE